MTTANSKNILSLVALLAVGISVSSASVEALGGSTIRPLALKREIGAGGQQGAGQEAGQGQSGAGTQVKGQFCNRFTETAGSISEKLSGIQSRIDGRGVDKTGTIDGNRATRDANLKSVRLGQDTRRAEWYAKLDETATTDAQKTAVEEFKKTVDAAVMARRSAVDSAIAAFRSGVDALVSGKKTSATSAADNFRSAVDAAITVAKSDCAAGNDPEAIRSMFRASLKAAKDTLATERKSVEGIGPQIDTLAKTRNAATKSAVETFNAALKAATEKLKTAFPVSK
ncbi:MAG: hypothetical protein WCJ25_02210 [Candidatus Moraniibacteriota bacterium]